jgi:AcrR family transcriptional regulator
MNKTPSRGRRSGTPDTREAIRLAARTRFLAEGYQDVTLRTIASDAGVDVALISYYFGSKQGLFGAAMALPVNPAELFGRVLESSPTLDGLAAPVLRMAVTTWDNPETGGQLKALASAAVADENLARLIREAVGREIGARLAARLGGEDGRRRAAAFVTQMGGLVFARYLMKFEPIASMSVDEIVETLAPPLQLILTGSPDSSSRAVAIATHAYDESAGDVAVVEVPVRGVGDGFGGRAR